MPKQENLMYALNIIRVFEKVKETEKGKDEKKK